MSISDSRFNMWRAVTAMVHADSVVRPHEVNFIVENIRKLPLSDEQIEILSDDLQTPRDIEVSFREITAPRDREDFFHLARAIAWSDGDFDDREQALLDRIRSLPMAAPDAAMMEDIIKNFHGIYIEGGTPREDQSLFSMIRGLLGAKAA